MTVSAYGYCPTCNAPGIERERSLTGNTVCTNGHAHVHGKFKVLPPQSEKERFLELAKSWGHDTNQVAGGVFSNPTTRQLYDAFIAGVKFNQDV